MPPDGALPRSATSFVGRDDDLAALAALAVRPDVRLITLTGSPGVGKTRLAIELAHRLSEQLSMAAHYVSLAEVTDAVLVPSVVAATLGHGDALANAAEWLAAEPTLLVLDNFEHVLAAGRDVATLIDACPALTVIATSRHALELAAEWCYPVAPLAVPAEDGDGDALACDAVALLVARLQTTSPRNEWLDRLAELSEIARRLDGLPLALELVAARARTLPLDVIRDALAARLDLLSHGAQDAPQRHRTMLDAIAWSYHLLEAASAALFRRLAVCVGDLTVETAEALMRDTELTGVPLLDALGDLAAHSLLERAPDGRFRMLEVVREFARQELIRSGELETAGGLHCAHFLDVAEAAYRNLFGAEQLSWLERLHRDARNLAAATRWAVERRDSERALRLCLALRFLWYVRGPMIEGRALFAEALALPDGPFALRARALVEAAALARHSGDLAGGEALASEAHDIARNNAAPEVLAASLLQRGFIRHLAGRFDAARVDVEESLALSHDADDRLGVARALHHLGLIAYYGDADPSLAWELQVRCLTLFRELENERHVATALIAMAELARDRGDRSLSRELLDEALSGIARLQDEPLLSYALYVAAALAADSSHPSRAVRLLGAAESVERSCGAAPWPAVYAGTTRWLPEVVTRLGQPRVDALRNGVRGIRVADAIELAREARNDDPTDPLTAREREIAQLVAEGMNNRAIAARLVISQRTVEGHVAQILAKLGFGSRSQIAVWVSRHGLTLST